VVAVSCPRCGRGMNLRAVEGLRISCLCGASLVLKRRKRGSSGGEWEIAASALIGLVAGLFSAPLLHYYHTAVVAKARGLVV